MIRDQEMLEQLVSTVDDFVQNVLVPIEHQVEETEIVPESVIQQMRELGFFGLSISEEYGGLGLTMEEEVYVAFAFGGASPAFRSVFSTNTGIGSAGVILDGSEQQKQKYLPKLASGEYIGSFCLTETESGSDAAALKTTAKKEGDYYILNGTKRFITNAPRASTFTVMARTNPEIKSARGISAFIIEAGTPGISFGKIDKKMGQKGTLTCDVIFENCRVHKDQLIGEEGAGFITAMKVLDKGRLGIAAFSVGISERMLNDALKYACERKQFGQPIANFQLIQGMLADSKAEIYAAKCMVIDAARKRDQGVDVTVESSCAKMFATEMCGRVADRCVQIHGGAGYISEYAIEHLYRDVRLFRIYEGTTQIQQVIIAKHMIQEALK